MTTLEIIELIVIVILVIWLCSRPKKLVDNYPSSLFNGRVTSMYTEDWGEAAKDYMITVTDGVGKTYKIKCKKEQYEKLQFGTPLYLAV